MHICTYMYMYIKYTYTHISIYLDIAVSLYIDLLSERGSGHGGVVVQGPLLSPQWHVAADELLGEGETVLTNQSTSQPTCISLYQ